MAKQSNDASNDDGASTTTDLTDSFKDLKTQFEADEKDGKKPAGGDGDDSDDADDAEADDANDSDDTTDDDDSSNDDDTSDDDSDDSDDSDGKDTKGKQASEFRLSQFKGDEGTPEEYIKNLENGYLESSQEALKIKDRADGFERQVNAIKAAAGKDPEFGEKLLSLLKESGGDDSQGDGGFGDDKATQSSNNPFLVHAETEWNQNNEKSIKDFVEANPEVLTDPKINSEVKRWAKVYTREVYESEKRLMTTGEAMEMAYKQLGYEDKRNSEQSLVNGMKKNAAPTRPQGAKKKSGGSKPAGNTKQFSDLTLTLAEKMGMSKERLVKGTKR